MVTVIPGNMVQRFIWHFFILLMLDIRVKRQSAFSRCNSPLQFIFPPLLHARKLKQHWSLSYLPAGSYQRSVTFNDRIYIRQQFKLLPTKYCACTKPLNKKQEILWNDTSATTVTASPLSDSQYIHFPHANSYMHLLIFIREWKWNQILFSKLKWHFTNYLQILQ